MNLHRFVTIKLQKEKKFFVYKTIWTSTDHFYNENYTLKISLKLSARYRNKKFYNEIRIYYSLNKKCKLAVGNFTEEQAERVELNPIISSACQHIMELYCEVC